MMGHGSLETNELPRAAAFLGTRLADRGAWRLRDSEHGRAWGAAIGRPGLGTMKRYDQKAGTLGHDVIVPLAVDSADEVNRARAEDSRPATKLPSTRAPSPRTPVPSAS